MDDQVAQEVVEFREKNNRDSSTMEAKLRAIIPYDSETCDARGYADSSPDAAWMHEVDGAQPRVWIRTMRKHWTVPVLTRLVLQRFVENNRA